MHEGVKIRKSAAEWIRHDLMLCSFSGYSSTAMQFTIAFSLYINTFVSCYCISVIILPQQITIPFSSMRFVSFQMCNWRSMAFSDASMF